MLYGSLFILHTFTDETSDNPLQFAGRENDGTGLQLDRYRYYCYELLKYISEDPIRLAGGDINYYSRVAGNPVNHIDPLGLKRGDWWDIRTYIEVSNSSSLFIKGTQFNRNSTEQTTLSATARHYVTDALGSVMALTDDSGAVKTTYVYDPFGNVTITGEASDNPFQFAGRENDGTGLQLDRYRYYSYELLRYISEDPIGLAGGDVNFYIRVGNNPIRFIDPFGFCLTLKQQLIVSLASGTSASIASLAGAGPGVTGAASAITAGLTTTVLGGNLRDVGSNTFIGFISGVTGSYIEKMFLATTTSMKAAVATGTLTGMLEAISLAVDPIFGDTCKDAEKNSCGK